MQKETLKKWQFPLKEIREIEGDYIEAQFKKHVL